MFDTATLSSKFQISIPKAVRTARHWKAGQEFAFIPKGTGVLLLPHFGLDRVADCVTDRQEAQVCDPLA